MKGRPWDTLCFSASSASCFPALRSAMPPPRYCMSVTAFRSLLNTSHSMFQAPSGNTTCRPEKTGQCCPLQSNTARRMHPTKTGQGMHITLCAHF